MRSPVISALLKTCPLVPWACDRANAVYPFYVAQVAALHQKQKRVAKAVGVVGQPPVVIPRVGVESQPSLLYTMLVGMEDVQAHQTDECQWRENWDQQATPENPLLLRWFHSWSIPGRGRRHKRCRGAVRERARSIQRHVTKPG